MRRRILLPRALCCLVVLFATVAAADAVDTYLRAEMANQRLPGVAVAVLRRQAGFCPTLGLANIELNVPVTRDTVFKIGSSQQRHRRHRTRWSAMARSGSMTRSRSISKMRPRPGSPSRCDSC